jgi:hypothetical protein
MLSKKELTVVHNILFITLSKPFFSDVIKKSVGSVVWADKVRKSLRYVLNCKLQFFFVF